VKLSEIPKRIKFTLGAVTLFFLLALIFLPEQKAAGWLAGYSLGFFTIFLHYMGAKAFSSLSDSSFFGIYFLSIGLRFLLVLALFILIIIFGKIDQISFTVSFIISYIFHSVIEIILINKKLTNRTG